VGFVALALRIGLGGLLVVSGVLKAIDGPVANAASVAGYQLLPHALIAPFGAIFPYVEIVVGGYLLAGLFTRAAALVAAALFGAFAFAVGWATAHGLTINCGCFGSYAVEHPSWLHVAGDVALTAAALALARLGHGPYSIDERLERGSEIEPFHGKEHA
jgi:uncharacterized membrane protein YphA (DoxX/SURF4 family)